MKKSTFYLIMIGGFVIGLLLWKKNENQSFKSEDIQQKILIALPSSQLPKNEKNVKKLESSNISKNSIWDENKINGKLYSARGFKDLRYFKKKSQAEYAKSYLKEISSLEYSDAYLSKVGNTTQYFFPQTYKGISIYPEAGISLILEEESSLLAVDADYVENIENIENPLPEKENGSVIVLWTQRESQKTRAQYAYYRVKEGIETLIDPISKKILFQKKRRQY